jgi:class 3 adenylate cyclase
MGNSAGSTNSPLGYLKRTASAAPLLADAEPLRNQACAADDLDVPGLPAGRVTLLFTDVEGSTRLLRELGDAYAGALAEHRRILRSAFASHAGVEVDTQGDAFFVAFASAPDAAAAAVG